jgi:hypothetical protein
MGDQYSGKFRLYRLSDFDPLPGMRWFIKPIVPRYGVTLLFGEPKTGKKTFVGLSMACAIAAGIAWCGFPTIKGKVLYICGEGFFGVLRRVKAWEKLHGVEIGDNLRLLRVPINFFDKPDVDNALMALKMQGFEPDFVVIDTLARSMSGGKENATEDMSQVFEHMDYFRAELLRQQVQDLWTDTGVEIIHHTGKEGIDYRGSSVIKGAVDALIMVKSDIGSLEITLASKGYKDAADFVTFTVGCESVEVETEEGPEGVLAIKGCVDAMGSEVKQPTKADQKLAKMETCLICIGNMASHAEWFVEVHKQTATKDKDGKPKPGWSEKTFDRQRATLVEQGRVVSGDGKQGDCYSVVFTEQANKARWRAGVQPQPDTPEDADEADAEGKSETGSKPPSLSLPLREVTVTVGGFGTDKPPPNHRQNENDGGSRESRTESDSSVANDDLIKVAKQQLKDGKTEH